MKKSILAVAGLAAVAGVVAPLAGVSATANLTETVQLTVNKSCSMTVDSATNAVDLLSNTAPNAYAEKSGKPMSITCNGTSGWNVTATATDMTSTSTVEKIPFGAYGTTASVWSAKITLSGNDTTHAAIQNNFGDYSAATASGTIIVQNTVEAGETPKAQAVSGLVITPSYKAYVQANQPQGTYQGKMSYTFADLTSS